VKPGRGSRSTAPLFRNLAFRCTWLVSLTHGCFFSGDGARYPFNRRPSGPQNCSRRCTEEENFCSCQESNCKSSAQKPCYYSYNTIPIICNISQLRQNFRTGTLNMLSSIYTASTFVPPCFKNVTMSAGKATRPAALQGWRWAKSSNATNENIMSTFYCPSNFKNIQLFGRNVQALRLFGKVCVP